MVLGDEERRLLIQLITADEKHYQDTIARMCAIRTALAQGVSPDDLTVEQCKIVAGMCACHSDEEINGVLEMGGVSAGCRVERVIKASTLATLALRWHQVVVTKEKGGMG